MTLPSVRRRGAEHGAHYLCLAGENDRMISADKDSWQQAMVFLREVFGER